MNAILRFSSLFVAVSALASAAACAPAADDGGVDETSEDSAELRLRGNSGFFVVTRPDFRRCIAPLCGGYFVKRVNATTSRCGDGSYASECYVSELDLDAIGLNHEEKEAFKGLARTGKAILRGGFESFDWNGTRLARLHVREGWKGANGADISQPGAGVGYRLTSSGIVCITSPCPTLTEAKLNSASKAQIHDLDLGTTAPQEVQDEARDALSTEDGILVTGNHQSFRGPGGRGRRLVATEFYTRVKPAPIVTPVDQACGSRGLAPCPDGQYCEFPDSAQCGALDTGGTCRVAPTVCNRIFRPVCGCDGQTYSNSCEAQAASTSVASEGACP